MRDSVFWVVFGYECEFLMFFCLVNSGGRGSGDKGGGCGLRMKG